VLFKLKKFNAGAASFENHLRRSDDDDAITPLQPTQCDPFCVAEEAINND